jgi:hypothetical protein
LAKQKRTSLRCIGCWQKTDTGMLATPASRVSHLANSVSGRSLMAL